MAVVELLRQRDITEHVIQTAPFPLEPVGAACPMPAADFSGHFFDVVVSNKLYGCILRIVVEIAGDEDERVAGDIADRIDDVANTLGHKQAIGACPDFASRPAGGVHADDMQRVAAPEQS